MIRNSREVTVTADGLLERVARRLLKRPPREDLSESPIAGKPQTMYQFTPGDSAAEHKE
jgi:hypothetical protein